MNLDNIKKAFTLDLRALAVFRVGIAGIILGDLFTRLSQFEAFYTEAGIFPRTLIVDLINKWVFSIHLINDTEIFQILMFLLAGIFGLLLLTGYKTRLAVFISWILLISLQNRNPFINSNADIQLALLLFWSNFLPLGAKYSLDSLGTKIKEKTVTHAGTAGYTLQNALMYFFAALQKSFYPMWLTEGKGVFYALNYGPFQSYFAKLLLPFSSIVYFLNYAVLFFELIGPILIVLLSYKPLLRTFLVFLFMFMHLGFGLFLQIGIFPFVSGVALIALLPTIFWDWIERKIIQHFSILKYYLLRLEKKTFKSYKKFYFLKQFRKKSPPKSPSLELPSILKVLAVFFICFILLWNFIQLPFMNKALLIPLAPIAYGLRINQKWDLWPNIYSVWLVIPGKFSNGDVIDIYQNKEVSWDEPVYISSVFKTRRWIALVEQLYFPVMQSYSRYLCKTFNSGHNPDKLESLEIFTLTRMNFPPYQKADIRRDKILSHTCP